MFNCTIKIWLNISAVVFFSLGMFSQAWAQEHSNLVCPNGYAILGAICVNEMSGDVVNPHQATLFSNAVRTTPSSASLHPAQIAKEIPQACATRDLAAWALIELRGESQDLSADTVADAAFKIIDARRLCRAGRSEEALEIYGRVISRMSNADR